MRVDASRKQSDSSIRATSGCRRGVCGNGGTVKLAACRGGRGRIAERDDDAGLPQLCRPPVSGRDLSHAIWLYFRFPLSLRMVEEMLAARGIVVSHVQPLDRVGGSRRLPLALRQAQEGEQALAGLLQAGGDAGALQVDFPPWSGGVRSERHAAARMVIPSMLARASAGVR